MGTIMRIDSTKAANDPEAVFGDPSELAHHIGLTRGQKIAALERWIAALQERLAADADGEAARLLGDVTATLAELRKDGDVPGQ